jgi:hypothetical protein
MLHTSPVEVVMVVMVVMVVELAMAAKVAKVVKVVWVMDYLHTSRHRLYKLDYTSLLGAGGWCCLELLRRADSCNHLEDQLANPTECLHQ